MSNASVIDLSMPGRLHAHARAVIDYRSAAAKISIRDAANREPVVP
jgi:hypothetical protein